jgi:hypothetical protein
MKTVCLQPLGVKASMLTTNPVQVNPTPSPPPPDGTSDNQQQQQTGSDGGKSIALGIGISFGIAGLIGTGFGAHYARKTYLLKRKKDSKVMSMDFEMGSISPRPTSVVAVENAPQPVGRPPDGTAVDGTAVDGTAVDGTAVDGTAVDGTAVDSQLVGDQSRP